MTISEKQMQLDSTLIKINLILKMGITDFLSFLDPRQYSDKKNLRIEIIRHESKIRTDKQKRNIQRKKKTSLESKQSLQPRGFFRAFQNLELERI